MIELTPTEIATLRAAVAKAYADRERTPTPTESIPFESGPLDGLFSRVPKGERAQFVSHCIMRSDGPVVAMYERHENVLRFREIEIPAERRGN